MKIATKVTIFLSKPDLTKGNYIELLESGRYYTATPGRRVQRQRIFDNLLGGKDFCPIIRRTEKLAAMEEIDLRKRCEEVVTSYPAELLRRALSYLYNKETKSSFGFVFMHPFEDGNGRIHRFLIHNILFLRGTIPKGLMFPVSAAMLKNLALYDHCLEAFSNALMRLVEYDLDDLGQMTVPGETGHLYRYIDMTAQAEALYDFVNLTIEHELLEELDFLVNYDRTKEAIQEILDMPDRLIDLFIQLCLKNNGRLSARKRESHFGFLTDDELTDMENAVREGYATE